MCHNCWISRHRIFKNMTARGQTSVSWC
ncbi:hypothetical protein [Acaryochloris marina]|nr:hypothetical protein [Acaryochloris marina]